MNNFWKTSETMVGIYVITNKLNDKKYIGQSKNIFKRWYQHYYESIKNQDNDNSVFHSAIRRYGIENFEFGILELCEITELDDREKFYISLYETNTRRFGYNIAEGGFSLDNIGENNSSSKLTEKDVYLIRDMYGNKVTKKEAYAKFSDIISMSTFSDVWNGKTWKHIHMDVYTEENKKYQKNNFDRISNHYRVVSDEDVLKIKNLYNEGILSKSEVYDMFSYINHNTFNDIWFNHTFQHIQSDIENQRNKIIRTPVDQCGCNNPSAKFSETDVITIRNRKNNGEQMTDVYNDYKEICKKQTFKKLWDNKTYQNIILNKEE